MTSSSDIVRLGLCVSIIPKPRHSLAGFKRFGADIDFAGDRQEYLFWIKLDDAVAPPSENDKLSYPDQGLGFVWLEQAPPQPSSVLTKLHFQYDEKTKNKWFPLYARDKEDMAKLQTALQKFLEECPERGVCLHYKEFSRKLARLILGWREEDVMTENLIPNSTYQDSRDTVLVVLVPGKREQIKTAAEQLCVIRITRVKMQDIGPKINEYAGEEPNALFNRYLVKLSEKGHEVIERKCRALEKMLGWIHSDPDAARDVERDGSFRYVIATDGVLEPLERFVEEFDMSNEEGFGA
ncbi:hypothetical protein FRC09_004166 [Ceratobasidium sp. 395]|nr:hypothetical protein FRC09_004166 [Ceratobasidium sp. 395]